MTDFFYNGHGESLTQPLIKSLQGSVWPLCLLVGLSGTLEKRVFVRIHKESNNGLINTNIKGQQTKQILFAHRKHYSVNSI